MFGYCGESEADVRALYAGLTRACANDPTLYAVAEGCSRHCHGWGYVIHAENGLFHYRTARSIYEDEVALPKLQGQIRAIFHGRYASNPDLAGHIFSHPFVGTNNEEVIYLAHNGGVTPEHPHDRTVDSEWVLEELVRHPDTSAALPKLKQHTRSALNLLILKVGRAKGTPATLQYFHYFKPKEPEKMAYYKLFLGSMPGGRALVSSTLTMADAGMSDLRDLHPAEFDRLETLG
jgi:glutamine amidotransferase